MGRHRFDSLRAAAIAALVLFVPISAYGDSSDSRLLRASSVVADDGSTRITLSFDLFHQIPDETPRVGALLRKILPSAFRGYRQRFGIEGIHVHDTIALMAVLYPELFTMQEMCGDVETMGDLTTGMTVFDRRRIPARQSNMEVAMDLEKDKVIEQIIRGLNAAAGREASEG